MPYSYISVLSPYLLTVAHILPLTKFKPAHWPTGAPTVSDRSTSAPQPATSIITTYQYHLSQLSYIPPSLLTFVSIYCTYLLLSTYRRKEKLPPVPLSELGLKAEALSVGAEGVPATRPPSAQHTHARVHKACTRTRTRSTNTNTNTNTISTRIKV
jgi:hypothetical protein